MARQRRRLQVQKTYKLFIGGKFVRGENGRVMPARDPAGRFWPITLALRERISAMRSWRREAQLPGWSKQSAYLRGQILYRAAEMLEMRRGELESELARVERRTGATGAPRNNGRD